MLYIVHNCFDHSTKLANKKKHVLIL